MSKLKKAIHEIHLSDASANRIQSMSMQASGAESFVHPLSCLLVTFFYLLLVVSFSKYDLTGVLSMVLYLLILGTGKGISLKEAVGRTWPVLLLVSAVGIANPFVEREICWRWGQISVSYGMISMLTLMLKGIFCVLASYLLIISTGMEGICLGLRCLHLPKELVTIVFLIHRYLIVLLKEAERMMLAYKLRAPGQKGIHFKAWGSFLGLLLLRSMDRAETVYESMLLRGYQGEIRAREFGGSRGKSILYVCLWTVLLVFLRVVPVFEIVGNLF